MKILHKSDKNTLIKKDITCSEKEISKTLRHSKNHSAKKIKNHFSHKGTSWI